MTGGFYGVQPNRVPGNTGLLFVVTAPSGAGKSSLIAAALQRDRRLRLSVSHTTRKPRPGEQDGVAYHFVGAVEFSAMQARDEFLECAEVHGNRYGTSRRAITEATVGGSDVVLEIDWQGAAQVRRLLPGCISIFILPPSLAVLEERLRGRGHDSEEAIARRLRDAREDVTHAGEFDYVIINREFDEARDDLLAVVRAERSRASRVLGSASAP